MHKDLQQLQYQKDDFYNVKQKKKVLEKTCNRLKDKKFDWSTYENIKNDIRFADEVQQKQLSSELSKLNNSITKTFRKQLSESKKGREGQRKYYCHNEYEYTTSSEHKQDVQRNMKTKLNQYIKGRYDEI